MPSVSNSQLCSGHLSLSPATHPRERSPPKWLQTALRTLTLPVCVRKITSDMPKAWRRMTFPRPTSDERHKGYQDLGNAGSCSDTFTSDLVKDRVAEIMF